MMGFQEQFGNQMVKTLVLMLFQQITLHLLQLMYLVVLKTEIVLSQTTTSYGGITYSRGSVYNAGESVTIIEFRGGVAENATDLNTTKLGEIKLFAEGNTAGRPPAVAGSGGGHGYVQNWQSGTGIVYGASGGGTNLTREITGLRGDNDSATTFPIAGAGTVKVGVDGQIGNNTSTVTPATASYEVGAGAGGVLVMGLAFRIPN